MTRTTTGHPLVRTLMASACAAAMLLTTAACGGSDASAPKDSGGSGTSSSSDIRPFDVSGVSKVDDIAALVPDSVAKDGKLTVGMDTSYAPAEFLDADGKTPIGYDVDFVKALARIFGLKAEPVTSTFDSILPSIGSKYDLGISSFTITPERIKAVDFVSFYKAGSTWAVRKGNPDGFDSSKPCGRKIAVQTGTTQESEVNKDVTTNVVTGKADAFYADSPVAGYAIRQTGGQLEAFGHDVGVTEQGVAIAKGDTAMAQAVQKAMQHLMDDGTYRKILDHWGVGSGAIDKAEINPTDVTD